MAINGITSYYEKNKTLFRVLTEAQVESMIQDAFEILEKTGVKSNAKICEFFRKAGAVVEGNVVKIPRQMVIDAINSAPKSVKLYNRNGDKEYDVTGTNVFVSCGLGNPFFQDFETNERRDATVQDCANVAKILDALDGFDFVIDESAPADVPVETKDLYLFKAMLENTDKPLCPLPLNIDILKDQVKMLEAVYGSLDEFRKKPSVVFSIGCTLTPLESEAADCTDKYIFCAENNIPQILVSFIQLGTVAPVTLANAMALSIAECFYLLCITQIANPGAPVLLSSISATVDMSKIRTCYGTPEHVLCEAAGADVFHYLGLPSQGTGGAVSAKIVDEQCAIEQAFTLGLAALDGGNIIHNVGFMEDGLSSHYDSFTMANEIIGYARRIERGIRFDEETTDLTPIHEVGHGGSYILRDETAENCREEVWYPELIEHDNYGVWMSKGSKDFRTRMHEKTKAILEAPDKNRLTPEASAAIDEIIALANKRYGK